MRKIDLFLTSKQTNCSTTSNGRYTNYSETNQVISPRYGTLNNMIAIGQVTNGVNKLRNGVKMIVDQAVNSVNYLYENQSKFDHFNS